MQDYNEKLSNIKIILSEATEIINNNIQKCLQNNNSSEIKCLHKNPYLSYSKIKIDRIATSSIPSIISNIKFLEEYCINNTQIAYNTCINLSNSKVSESIDYVTNEIENVMKQNK